MRGYHDWRSENPLIVLAADPDRGVLAISDDLHRAARLKNISSGIAGRVQKDAIQNVAPKGTPKSVSRRPRHARV
ncbi:hypothetical protein EN839_34325, partial [Mesorhizobium sp. M1C.F.Ca.ET.196.01.1.1]|uniref:hypothetical protein n=1 Tax=Mesorhizobium sp. M1C.F.Ca.ET.196.01.1.1 TaxID=2563928 RepID=UPI0010928EBE